MKQLRILLIVLPLFLLNKSLIAQNYSTYLNNSCWRVLRTGLVFFERVVWYIPEKDTLIGSKVYTKYIDSARNRLEAFVREDVSAKKVYKWQYREEKILYDFSLNVGDTIRLSNNHLYKVYKIDSINAVDGRKLRRTSLKSSTYPILDGWIESIGSYGLPFTNTFELPSDPDYYLLCNYQNGIPIYNSEFSNGLCKGICCPIPPIVGNSKQHVYKWFPNPFTYKSTYLSEKNLQNVLMTVYNSIGQKVYEEKIGSGYTINLFRKNLAAGIYFVQLTGEDKKVVTDKLIIGTSR